MTTITKVRKAIGTEMGKYLFFLVFISPLLFFVELNPKGALEREKSERIEEARRVIEKVETLATKGAEYEAKRVEPSPTRGAGVRSVAFGDRKAIVAEAVAMPASLFTDLDQKNIRAINSTLRGKHNANTGDILYRVATVIYGKEYRNIMIARVLGIAQIESSMCRPEKTERLKNCWGLHEPNSSDLKSFDSWGEGYAYVLGMLQRLYGAPHKTLEDMARERRYCQKGCNTQWASIAIGKAKEILTKLK